MYGFVSALPCAHSSRRLRSTILPPSIYTRGTRLLTAQVRPHRALRGGDPDLILVGQAEPALPKVLPHAAKRLDAALRRLASLRSQQPQAPLHDFAAFDIHPRHPLAHRAGQAPPRVARRGPRSHFGRPGRARPPQGFAARGKTLGRRAAAARFPALTAAAGSAPRFCRLRYTPAAPACSPRRSAHRGWCSEWPPGHPPAGGGRTSPPRPRP